MNVFTRMKTMHGFACFLIVFNSYVLVLNSPGMTCQDQTRQFRYKFIKLLFLSLILDQNPCKAHTFHFCHVCCVLSFKSYYPPLFLTRSTVALSVSSSFLTPFPILLQDASIPHPQETEWPYSYWPPDNQDHHG
jgi:hypothetical protein